MSDSIDWTRYDPLLGRVEDHLVAQAAACSTQAVYQRRRRRKIAAYRLPKLAPADLAADLMAEVERLIEYEPSLSWRGLDRDLGQPADTARRWRSGMRPMPREAIAPIRRWLKNQDKKAKT